MAKRAMAGEGRVDLELPYRFSLVGTAVPVAFLLAVAGGLGFELGRADTTQSFLIVLGRRVPDEVHLPVWIAVCLVSVAFLARRLVDRLEHPDRRIAFASRGLFLPSNRSWEQEAFVAYDEIEGYRLTGPFGGAPDRLRFDTPSGRYSIERRRLDSDGFEQVCEVFFERTRLPQA